MTGVVTYERVWWIMGPAPAHLRTRWPQAEDKPPTSGWGGVLVYRPNRSDAKYAQVFCPSTGWGSDVLLESSELNTSKPQNDWDETKMIARMMRIAASNDKLGVGMSYGKLNFFLEKMGAPAFVRDREDDSEEKEVREKIAKEPKVDVRAGLVQAGDIAAKLGIEARDLRNACRKLKIEKPSIGWAGSQAWADDIEARVRAFLAADAAPVAPPAPPPAPEKKTKKKKK